MRWLLDKPFEFTTAFSPEECERRLLKKSGRGGDFFASGRAIFVAKVPRNTGFRLKLDRDTGRNLSAEVWVAFKPEAETTRVSGYGRFPLVNFVFLMSMIGVGFVSAYAFRSAPEFLLIFALISLLPLGFSYIILRNRNDLIKVVHETLQSTNDKRG